MARSIADYLIESTATTPQAIGPVDRLRFAVARLIPNLRYRHLVFAFLLGGITATILVLAAVVVVKRRSAGR